MKIFDQICLILISFAFFGCANVQIKNEIWYADKGPLGAVQIQTLESGVVDIDKVAWDQTRVGMLCTSPETFVEVKKIIETLCSHTNSCVYPQINAFFDRLDKAVLVNIKQE